MSSRPWSVRDTFMASHHEDDTHLHFLVTDPTWDASGEVVCANFTSLKDSTVDRSCVVVAGEHRLVSRQSVVSFRNARISSIDDLKYLERRRRISRREPLSEDLYEKILDAFADSKHAPIETKDMLRDQCLI